MKTRIKIQIFDKIDKKLVMIRTVDESQVEAYLNEIDDSWFIVTTQEIKTCEICKKGTMTHTGCLSNKDILGLVDVEELRA